MLKKFLAASAIATGIVGLLVGGNAFAAPVSVFTVYPYTSGQNISVSGDINVCVSKTGGYTGDAIIADIRGTNYEKQIVFSDASCVAVADIPSDTNLKFIAPMGMGGLKYTSESGTVALNLDNATTVDKYLKISGSMGQRIEATATTLRTGKDVNQALKRLVGNGTEDYTSQNYTVENIQFVRELPASIDPDTANKINIALDGETPVYAYADNNDNIYIYTEAKNIMANADSSWLFNYMGAVTSLEIPDYFDVSLVTDLSWMFGYMFELTSLTLPNNFNTSNVTNMDGLFSEAWRLTSLTLPDTLDTSKVTSMEGMFFDNYLITELAFPNGFDTSNVESMFAMFGGMQSLTSLTLPDTFNTSNVTNMGGMFSGMSSLISLSFSDNFNTSSVTDMSHMFSGNSLVSLTLPDSFDTSNVTSMGWMFTGMQSLASLTLPDSFTIEFGTNTDRIFDDVQSTAVLCSADPTARSLWPGIFCGTTKLQSGQSVNEAIKRLAGDEGARYYDDNTSIKSIRFVDELPNGINPDTTAKANIGLDGLTPVYAYWDGNGNIYINSEAELIYANEASSSMFQDFVGLTTLDFSSIFSTAKVTNMRLFFYGNTELTSLILPSTFDTSKVTTMQQMFQNMSALIELHLPESFNTSNVRNMNYMFAGMTNLTTLTFTNAFNTENVENMAQMFHNMTSLTSLTLPETFNTSKVTTMNQMFLLCSSLTSLTLPAAFNTSKVDDMTQMFLLTTGLTELTLPDAFIVKDGASTDGIFATTSSTAVLNATNATIRSLWPGVLGN
ncbi:BspA family leucine-rich repeat surface protein [Candidatus Saccharibacteria bacterium]|nr:BspA family leucine-rich repeat surface protein [Candidatus Saccharibacteria bacterium]